jgi:hypothetical protein
VSLIPDLIGALRGGYTGHLTEWLGQVVGPALVPGNSSKLVFWDIWNGANLYNQSLRGVINRFATAFETFCALSASLMLRSVLFFGCRCPL